MGAPLWMGPFVAAVSGGTIATTTGLEQTPPTELTHALDRKPGSIVPQMGTTKVLYVHFDGLTLQDCRGTGSNDPRQDCTALDVLLDGHGGVVRPYSGNAADREAVLQSLRAVLDPYDIELTTSRPSASDEYDMEVVGNWRDHNGGERFAGIAPTIDCFDAVKSETSFTLDISPPSKVAQVVLQELAHTWGLEHTDAKEDVLYPVAVERDDQSFVDACMRRTVLDGFGIARPADASVCAAQHEMHCDALHQNSHAEMLMLFGPNPNFDDDAPTLVIETPTDGARVAPEFDYRVRVDDNAGVQELAITIAIDGDVLVSDTLAGPDTFSARLGPLPDGPATLSLSVTDAAGNTADASTAITVDASAPPGPGPGTTTGSGTGEPGEGGATEGAGGTEATAAADAGLDGGGCRSFGRPPTLAPWALFIPGLGLRRRRRPIPTPARQSSRVARCH